MPYANTKTGELLSEDNAYASIMSGQGGPPTEYTMKGLDQEIEDKTDSYLQDRVAEIENKDWEYKDYEMLTRQFLDGMVFNFADEIGATAGAVAVKLFNPDLVKEKSIAEIRDEMLVTLNTEGVAFREREPVASTIATLAGALVSPVSLKGGQLISAGDRVRKAELARNAAMTARGGSRVAGPMTSAAGGAAIQTAEQAASKTAQLYSGMSPAMYSVVSKTPTYASAAGLGLVEGAVAGAGGAIEGERLEGAVIGASLGAAMPLALKGVGTAFTAATRNRLAQDLGSGKDFVSLMFADIPGGVPLANIYRNVVAKGFGGRTLMEQQARRMASRIPSSKKLAALKKDMQNSVKLSLDTAREAIAGNTTAATRGLTVIKTNAIEGATSKKGTMIDELDVVHKEKLADLDEAASANKEKMSAIALKEADENVNALEGMFRSDAFERALPAGAPAELVEGIDQLTPAEALVHLDGLWKNHGFRVADDIKYPLNAAAVVAVVKKIVNGDKEAAALFGETGKLASISTYIENSLKNSMVDGVLDGRALVELRSGVGTVINGLSEDKNTTRTLGRKVQEYLDGILTSRFTKEQLKTFTEEKQQWAVFKTAEDSVFRATGRKGNIDGAFTGEDWINSLKANSKWLSSRNLGYLQKEATERMNDSVAVRESMSAVAASRIKEAHKIASDAVKAEKRAKLRQKTAITEKYNVDKKRLRDEFEDGVATVERKAILARKQAELKAQLDSARTNIDAEIESASQQEAWFLKNRPRGEDSSMFEALFANALIGTVAESVVPMTIKDSIGGTIATGFVGASVLAREGFQRALVGQSGWQRGGAELGEKAASLGEDLGARGITSGGVSGSVVTAASQEGMMFDGKIKKAIRSMPIRRQGLLFEGLLKRGTADRLKREDPALYKELKAAYDAR
tara:strand:- start:13 stop:2760 length:2748 start_codon:yes stop_codon:yes gene_type:complete